MYPWLPFLPGWNGLPSGPRKNVEHLKELAYKMLKSTGHEEISLSSLSSSDYSELEELVNFLIDEFKGKGVNISLPSLRIDAFSLDVMSKVQDIKKSSLTFAPEAGSQRLRDVINKGLTEEVILNGSRLAFEGGWNKVKLYFMLGLPTETEEDMKAIPQLANEIAALYYDTVPKENGMENVRLRSAPLSLCRSHLLRSSGQECTHREIILQERGWSMRVCMRS